MLWRTFAIQLLSLAVMHAIYRQNIIISFCSCMQVGISAAGKAICTRVCVGGPIF